MRQFMSGDGGYGRLYSSLGYRCSETVRQEGFLELICGRIYADPDRASQMFLDGMPMSYDLEALKEDPSLLEGPPTSFNTEKADGRFLATLPANLLAMIRASRRMARGKAVGVPGVRPSETAGGPHRTAHRAGHRGTA
jgi:hypothetical protein